MKKSTLTKLICIVLMALMVFSITACVGSGDTDTEPTTAVVAYDTVGGQLPEGTEEIKEYEIGKKIMLLPTPTKTGYTFLGWEINGEAVMTPYTVNGDVTFTAKWEALSGSDTDSDTSGGSSNTDTDTEEQPKVTIYLDANGGTLPAGSLEEFEAVIDDEIGKLPTPTRPGYEFLGWFEDGNSKWEVDKKTEVAKYDMTIVALWNALGNIVTVEFNIGTDATLSIETPYFEMVAGQKIKDFLEPLPTATRSGYTFGGWQDESGARITLTSVINKDTLLSPIWNRIVLCLDGTENHQWNAWQASTEATCTSPAQSSRQCGTCGHEEYNVTQEALGHKYGGWEIGISETSGAVTRTRVCSECENKEQDPLKNITFTNFNTPVLDGDVYTGGLYGPGNLVDGDFTTGSFCGKGTGAVTVTIEAKQATYIDIFCVAGNGSSSYTVTVYYADGNSQAIGIGSFGSTKPFDVYAEVTKIEVCMESPSNGMDFWCEIAALVVNTGN